MNVCCSGTCHFVEGQETVADWLVVLAGAGSNVLRGSSLIFAVGNLFSQPASEVRSICKLWEQRKKCNQMQRGTLQACSWSLRSLFRGPSLEQSPDEQHVNGNSVQTMKRTQRNWYCSTRFAKKMIQLTLIFLSKSLLHSCSELSVSMVGKVGFKSPDL